MNGILKKLALLLAIALLLLTPAWAEVVEFVPPEEILLDGGAVLTEEWLVEYGLDYSAPEEVALYLHVFCELPPNFLTKAEARDWGWVSSEGNLWDVAEGMSIGGDSFGNREGLLPEDEIWYECDVNYDGGFRGGERLVFSETGQIYYTADHYESFDLWYEGWYELTDEEWEELYGDAA